MTQPRHHSNRDRQVKHNTKQHNTQQRGTRMQRGRDVKGGGDPAKQYGRVSPARVVAYETLLAVETHDAYANLVLPGAVSRARLDRRDASLATELTYGTLRMQGSLDWVIQRSIGNRRVADLDPEVRVILRMTVHQILHMRVPNHASVAESVELAKHACGRGTDKFVNGVARGIVERGNQAWERDIHTISNDVEQLSVEYSHPQWIVRAFASALLAHGRDPGELMELLDADNRNPEVTLCARPGLIHPYDLAQDIEDFLHVEARLTEYSEWAVVMTGGDPGRLYAVREGRAAVQDEGSQLVGTLFADRQPDCPDTVWLDMCAGPGGKTGLIASLARSLGIRVVANEVAEHRARLVEQSVKALDNVDVIVGDGREVGQLGRFSRILLDAPCSGLGALRRRPESRWRRQPGDISELVPLQAELLDAAMDALEPGGHLLYVTCSPHAAETVDQIEALVARRDDVIVKDTKSALQAASMAPIDISDRRIGQGRVAQLWPHVHGTDAMFLALLSRKATK